MLDFLEGSISGLTVNNVKTEARIDNGHIALPAMLLKSGENTVSMDFSAPIATAGKAITRFEDKDDGSEYLYTLFVPMDAEMAFPCFDQPDIKGRFRLEVSAPPDWTVIGNQTSISTSVENVGAAQFSSSCICRDQADQHVSVCLRCRAI